MPLIDLASRLQPTGLVARAYERLLEHVKVDEAWEAPVRGAAERGPLVYVLRNVAPLDLLALDYLARRHGLPRIGFANELEQWLRPTEQARRSRRELPSVRLRAALAAGESAVLFLKGKPDILDRASPTHRGKTEGDALLLALLDHERTRPRDGGRGEVVLVPQTFVWTQRPERLGFSVVDMLFGPSEFPGELRATAQVLLNYKNCVVRAGDPLRMSEFLEQQAGADDDAIVRRLTYALLRKVERERRAVLGPAQKAPDRVREEVLRSPRLQSILRDLAGPDAAQQELLTDKARGMLRELQAEPDPATLKGLEVLADTLVDRVYAGIDVDEEGIERVREAARKGSIMLLPSHKSHVDYLLMSYVFRKHALQIPVVAAGDNLSFFPVGPIFRRAGAFFIRRSFKGDRLYTAVVDAYVRRLIRDGFAIEFFLEGGRSRSGKLLPPKLGLLNMVVDAALAVEGRTISFVPVSIGYERMMEEGSFARELSGLAKKQEDAAALLKLGEVLREKYGRANVQFGQIVELDAMRARLGIKDGDVPPAKRRALVTRLAHIMMSEINRATAVTPGSLVATVLLCHSRRGLPHAELVDQCARLTRLVRKLGARTTPSLTRSSGEMREHGVREAALLYVRGGLVKQYVPGDTLTGSARKRARIYTGDDVIYTVPPDQRLSLDIAKNIIVHLFVDRGLVSVALIAPPGPPATAAALRERVQSLSRLFKNEFMFRADASFDQIFDETLGSMIELGELARSGDSVTFGDGHDGLDGRGWIGFYARVMRSFLEGYRIAARTARVLVRGPMPQRDLIARALRIGEQMYLGGEIECSEAVSQSLVENAFGSFIDQGYFTRSAGKLALAESFASEETAPAIEARFAAYLAHPGAEP